MITAVAAAGINKTVPGFAIGSGVQSAMLGLGTSAAAAVSAIPRAAGGAARTAVRTANALFSTLFGLVNVPSSGKKDHSQNGYNNEIACSHYDFTPLNAYSRFKSCSDFTHR